MKTRFLIINWSVLLLVSCVSDQKREIRLPSAPPEMLPGDDSKHSALRTKALIDSAGLDSLVIGAGTGVLGYDSFYLDAHGYVEVVLMSPDQSFLQHTTAVSPTVAQKFLQRDAVKSAVKMRNLYTSQTAGGNQGFAHFVNDGKSSRMFASNYFPKEFTALWKDAQDFVATIPRAKWKTQELKDGFNRSRLSGARGNVP